MSEDLPEAHYSCGPIREFMHVFNVANYSQQESTYIDLDQKKYFVSINNSTSTTHLGFLVSSSVKLGSSFSKITKKAFVTNSFL